MCTAFSRLASFDLHDTCIEPELTSHNCVGYIGRKTRRKLAQDRLRYVSMYMHDSKISTNCARRGWCTSTCRNAVVKPCV